MFAQAAPGRMTANGAVAQGAGQGGRRQIVEAELRRLAGQAETGEHRQHPVDGVLALGGHRIAQPDGARGLATPGAAEPDPAIGQGDRRPAAPPCDCPSGREPPAAQNGPGGRETPSPGATSGATAAAAATRATAPRAARRGPDGPRATARTPPRRPSRSAPRADAAAARSAPAAPARRRPARWCARSGSKSAAISTGSYTSGGLFDPFSKPLLDCRSAGKSASPPVRPWRDSLSPDNRGHLHLSRIGELLVKAGKLTPEQLQQALAAQQDQGGRLGTHLVKLGFIDDEDLVEFLSQHYGVPAINLAEVEIDETIIKLIPPDVARKYTILPVSKAGATLTIAMVDPTNVFAMDDIKFMTGYNVEPVVASEIALREAIEKYYGSTHALELKKVMDEMADGRRRRPRGARGGGGARPRRARAAVGRGAGRHAGQHHPHRRDQEGRLGHPHRALREGVPRPLPHRRRALRDHAAADQAQGRDHQPHQDHGQAGHRREAPAPGRPHQDQDQAAATRSRRWTSASRCCRRSSARRSSCGCSTRTT